MNEHPLREHFHKIITAYDDITIALEHSFREKGWMSEFEQIHFIEADPTHLECITDKGEVWHIHYDELQDLLNKGN